MPTPDHSPLAIQEFVAWTFESSCYSVGNLASNEKQQFVPLKAAEAYLAEDRNARLNRLLAEIYEPEDPPTYAEAILRRYTAVFCILLEIGKGNFIHQFTEHDALRDSRLPFKSSSPPPQFPKAADNGSTFQQFCDKQWRYSVPTFERLDTFFPTEQVLPIVQRDQLTKDPEATLWKVVIHEDYNRLRSQKLRLVTPDTGYSDQTYNTFVLKSYHSEVDFEKETRALKRLRSDQGILAFLGNYVQDNTFNVLLEYADQGSFEQYYSTVRPPSTSDDIIKFWRQLFSVIRALVAIHEVAWDSRQSVPTLDQEFHLHVKSSNILVVSENATSPYDWKFKLADLGLSQSKITRSFGDYNITSGSYDASEFSNAADVLPQQDLVMEQSASIWSLGCVFSEAVTWVVGGYEGLLRYREQRRTENYAGGNMALGSSFLGVLDIVQEHHRRLLGMIRKDDYITQSVVDVMIEEMLEVPEGRPTADQLWIKSQRVLSKAEDRCATATDDLSGRSKTTIVPKSSDPGISSFVLGHSELPKTGNAMVEISEQPNASEDRLFPQQRTQHLARNSNFEIGSSIQDKVDHHSLTSGSNSPDFGVFPHQEYIEDKTCYGNVSAPNSTTSEESGSFVTSLNTDYTEPEAQQQRMIAPRLTISNPEEFTIPNLGQKTEAHLETLGASFQSSKAPNLETTMPVLTLSEARTWKNDRKSRIRDSLQLDDALLYRLSKRDQVFLVDDAISMVPYWREVGNVLEILSYMIKVGGCEGVDLYFTNSTQHFTSKHATKLLKALEGRTLEGHTEIVSSLNRILDEYNSRTRGRASSKSLSKLSPAEHGRPVNIYVLTNGIWEGNTEETFAMIEKGLTRYKQEGSQVNIQNNVDVTSSKGNVWKMLLVAKRDEADRRISRPFMRLPAMKQSLRRMSTFSVRSSSSKIEKDRSESVTSDREKVKIEPPASGIIEWTHDASSTIDILFIHGLDSDRETNWTFHELNSINWPRDLLPLQIPSSRIMTFGYDSTPWYSSYPIKDVVTAQATELLEDIRKSRKDCLERPLILVMQGIGGLIAKCALLQSHLAIGSEMRLTKGIKLSTTGMVFLGTPDIQVSSDETTSAIFGHSGEAINSNGERKPTAQDATWLKLQLDSFQSISECFYIYDFHSHTEITYQPHISFLPTTVGPLSNQAKAMEPMFTQDPEQLVEKTASNQDTLDPGNTSQINKSITVERISSFRGEDDQAYRAVVSAISALCKEAAKRSKINWSHYDAKRISTETRDVPFNKSDFLRMVPQRNQHFIGRHADLERIYTTLFGDDASGQSKVYPSVIEIYGVGGVGKTQLALEFIHRYKHEFSTILWIDSQSRASVEKCFTKIERNLSRDRNAHAVSTQASRLNVSGSSESTCSSDSTKSFTLGQQKIEPQGLPSYAIEIVKAWLAKENNERWILVFDGADDENKSSWIQEFLPKTKHGHILITSRHRDRLKYRKGIRVESLVEMDGTRLLINCCLRDEENAALELVKRLDCLPLAITQAGAYIKSTNMTIGNYLSHFKEAKPRAWDEYASRMNLIFSTSVDEVSEKSYQEVKAKDRDALDVLVLCSFLAPENIPGIVLEIESKKSGIRLDDMVSTLCNNAFGHREENLQSFRMHTLVQSWVRKRQTSEKQKGFIARALSTLATVVESERLGSNDPKIFQGLEELLLGHIIACLSRVEGMKYGSVGWCVLGNVCQQQRRYGEAVKLYELGLSDPEIMKKKKPFQLQQLRFEFGSLYQMQGQYNDAVTQYEKTLERCNEDSPGENVLHIRGQLLLDMYKALSSIYTRIGRIAQSGAVLAEGISKLEKLFGPNSFHALQLLDICAAEYYDQEDYAQAETLYERIVASQIQTLGVEHPRTLHAQENLARAYFQNGKFQGAEALCQKSISSLEKILGAQHPAVLQQELFLGQIYTKINDYPEAVIQFERVIKGYELVLGLQHPETLNAKEELAMCYETQGRKRYKEAHAIYMQVMFGREDAKDPSIGETIRRLCSLLNRMGDEKDAKQLLAQYENGVGGF